MNKRILVGSGIGLLLLVLLAGYQFSVSEPGPSLSNTQTPAPDAIVPSVNGAAKPSSSAAPASNGNSDSTVVDSASDSAQAVPNGAASPAPIVKLDQKPLTREQRRAVRNAVRGKMRELLAKGSNVTAADTQAFIDDVEQLGQGVFDPRYFTTLREMTQYSAQAQILSKELSQISGSTASKDAARQQEIVKEMRDIGDRISNGSAALQSYAHDTIVDEKP